MCTWEEEQMAPLGIESTKDFVDRYIVVDKASEDNTVNVIKKCADEWKLNVEIYVKPDLLLRDARMFAIEKVDEDWMLILEGDEVFHTDGPNSIFNLKKLLKYRNVVFLTPQTILAGDLLHTCPPYKQPPHSFLYQNNNTFYPAELRRDVPEMIGVKIPLSKVYKFNCRVKSPKRAFLRQYWAEWCQTTNAFEKYGSLEEYVKAKLGSKSLDYYAKEWYDRYMRTLELYDPKKYGYYPKVIREYIDKANIRGYEKSGPWQK
jgi:glycosyltransferase involved in cell wall biosynthesis